MQTSSGRRRLPPAVIVSRAVPGEQLPVARDELDHALLDARHDPRGAGATRLDNGFDCRGPRNAHATTVPTWSAMIPPAVST